MHDPKRPTPPSSLPGPDQKPLDEGRRATIGSLASLTASVLVPGLAACEPHSQTTSNAKAPVGPSKSSGEPATEAAVARPAPTTQRDRLGELLPLRKLFPGGPEVTMLGVGGAHVADVSEAMAEKVIEAALEQGIRFFDTAAMYGDGESEKRFGRFLTPKYRDAIFLMTKAHARSPEGVERMLANSLRYMKVDAIDLWQIHDLKSEADVDNMLKDGVLAAFVKAQEQGKVKYLGFTGHTTPKAHARMVEVARREGIKMATGQMPINVVDPHYESFILNVVPQCLEAGVGVLAMKTLAYGRVLGKQVGWARHDAKLHNIVPESLSLEEALGFVWSLPVSVLISGMQSPDEVKQNAAIARRASSWNEGERQRRVDAVKEAAGPGVEFYKA